MPKVEFFPKNKRVRLRVHDTGLITLSDEEKRQKFDVSVVLTEGDDTMIGMPEWVQVAYAAMLKSRNLQSNIRFPPKFDGMAIDIFSTPKGKRTFSPIIDGNLFGFEMDRTGTDEEPQIALYFSMKFPGRKEIHEWTWEHKGQDCFACFEQQQGTLEMHPKPGESEDVSDVELELEADDEEDDDEDDEAVYEEGEDDEATPPVVNPMPTEQRAAVIAQSAKARQAQFEVASQKVEETQAIAAKRLKLM